MTIAIAYTVLVAVVLWFVIGSRGNWHLKLPIILAVPALAIGTYFALAYRTGWPTTDTPPKHGLFVSGVIDEPHAIYLWLATGSKPRAYRLPYSRQLHKQVDEANSESQHGKRVAFRLGGGQRASGKFIFYRLPVVPPSRKTR
jgi:hypothetical protein